jgi:hypothetical protein
MKVQLRNRIYTGALECFICSEPQICYIPIQNLMLARCVFRGECDLKNLYNDKIFKL